MQFTGFEAMERFAEKSHHGMRAENAHSLMYFVARSLLFGNLPLVVSHPVVCSGKHLGGFHFWVILRHVSQHDFVDQNNLLG